VLSYRAGDYIFREGDAAGLMYIVLKGSVEMSTKDKVVVTIPERKPFGMLSLIDKKPGERRSCEGGLRGCGTR
jgi:CRP/FNR family transcriptional regulator, cyclic AMP receptor protein